MFSVSNNNHQIEFNEHMRKDEDDKYFREYIFNSFNFIDFHVKMQKEWKSVRVEKANLSIGKSW